MPSRPYSKPQPPRHPERQRRAARRPVFQYDFFGPPRIHNRPFDPRRLAGVAVGIWRASKPVEGTLGEKFFRTIRVKVPDADTARFHASLKRGDERGPAVIFLLRDVHTGEATGCVRIFLDPETGWATERRALGRVVGASVMPRPP
jgi:hypothetical protein